MLKRDRFLSSLLEALGNTLGQRVVTGIVLALLGFMATTGRGMVKSVYSQETRSVMKPQIDTLQHQIDTLRDDQQKMKAAIDKGQAISLEMYSAMLEKDSILRQILEDRARNKRQAAQTRASNEKLFNDLTGDTK